ncbi:helix-turn-helix domain-containing protein [Clostridium perfringens]
MTTIADRIKEALEIRNMKQIDLVEKTQIGKSSISTYISGAYEPKQKNIYKIAKALNVDEAWLMGLDVPMEKVENIDLNSHLALSKEEEKHIEDLRKLNNIGKNKVINYTKDLIEMPKYQKDNNVTALPKKEKDIWEEPGKEYLMPIACHDDNLTDEEKDFMDQAIAEYERTHKK